jgi:hypothetical protein
MARTTTTTTGSFIMRYVAFGTEMEYKHTYKFCMKHYFVSELVFLCILSYVLWSLSQAINPKSASLSTVISNRLGHPSSPSYKNPTLPLFSFVYLLLLGLSFLSLISPATVYLTFSFLKPSNEFYYHQYHFTCNLTQNFYITYYYYYSENVASIVKEIL